MRVWGVLIGGVVALMTYTVGARAQSSDAPASPEMARLAQALVGEWSTTEVVQHGEPVPTGAGRRGQVRVRLAGGGTVLVSEGHSVGTVGGDLRWLITIWWDPEVGQYRFLTCFHAPDGAGCTLRGTAHWDGNVFINEYTEPVNGVPTRMADRWTEITPSSHTLTEWHDDGHGAMHPYVVSHDVRRQGPL